MVNGKLIQGADGAVRSIPQSAIWFQVMSDVETYPASLSTGIQRGC